MPGITDSHLKFGWAKKHLESLASQLRAFSKSNPYTFTREDDAKNQRHILRVNILDVPTDIALTVGDALYNLRSSLDQLVWALSRLKAIPPKSVQFPVIEDWTARGAPERFDKQVFGVCDEAVREIKSLQPYHRGTAYKADPLWRLNELCNLDKHRRIPVDSHVAEIRFPNLTPEDIASGTVKFEATDDGHVVSVPLALKHKLEFNPNITTTITFGGDISGISEHPGGIAEIYGFVGENVLPRFDRFFS